ncbi:hypothetical protein cypCar_00029136, partial [Cyprinus carpio]
YPDATPEDLQATDNVCIICREEMVTGAKKLPCNHIFHSSCLRSWFQRQQTCPTCRMDVLRASQPNQTPAPAPAQAPAPAAAANAPVPPPVNVAPGMMPQFPPGLFPFWGPLPGAPPPAAPGAPAATDAPQTSAAATPAQGAESGASSSTQPNADGASAAPGAMPGFPFSMPPPFPSAPWLPMPPPPPFMSSMPPPPSTLSTMSEAELRELEQEGRRGLEARLQCLQNIHTLLDAAMLNIHHYLSTVATLSPPRSETNAGETSTSANVESSSSTGNTETPSQENEAQSDGSVNGATGFSPPDSTTGVDKDRKDGDEDEDDSEPNAAELRRRRLRKLETTNTPDH